MAKLPLPDGHHTVMPGFMVPKVAEVIGFLERVFGGKVVDRYDGPGGAVMHAEVRIGDSVVQMGEAMPGVPPMPAMMSIHVDDADAVDATYAKALANGALSETEPKNQFYGYRSATVRDTGGNRWTICAIVEQLTKEEIEARMAKLGHG